MSSDNDPSQNQFQSISSNLPQPILALDHDILHEIFLWSADIFAVGWEYYPDYPDTIRHSSQVCSTWRSFLLNSPDIWGRLINLDALDQKTNFWRDEVLERSGNSFLEISGSISDQKLQVYKPADFFFFSILDSHWERIRHLRIKIRHDVPMERNLWSPLLRPAPNLQSFSLTVNSGVPSLLSLSTVPLFSDHAPILYHFTAEHLLVSLTAPWLSHLCILHLPSQFSVSAVLSALYSTDRLESLTVDGFSEVDSLHASPSFSVVMLPHLKTLILRERELALGIIIEFLTHIHYADQCGVEFHGLVGYNSPTEIQDLMAYSTLFPSILQRYLCTHTVYSFGLHLTGGRFKVWDSGTYELNIEIGGAGGSQDYYNVFASVLSRYDFSSITELDLKLAPPRLYEHAMHKQAMDSSTLSLFSGVTSLRADLKTLQTIIFMGPSNRKGPTCAAFPLLCQLEIDQQINEDDDLSPILECIYGRVDSEKPMFELDLGHAENWRWGCDIEYELEQITGLRVVWGSDSGKMCDYICGSGFPRRILSSMSEADR